LNWRGFFKKHIETIFKRHQKKKQPFKTHFHSQM
jgi:hypothetical protein